jgi:hypothetical protein
MEYPAEEFGCTLQDVCGFVRNAKIDTTGQSRDETCGDIIRRISSLILEISYSTFQSHSKYSDHSAETFCRFIDGREIILLAVAYNFSLQSMQTSLPPQTLRTTSNFTAPGVFQRGLRI